MTTGVSIHVHVHCTCSVVSVGVMLELTQVQLKHYLTSISQRSTNQIVKKMLQNKCYKLNVRPL